MIERKIVIGLITSTEYLKRIRPLWDTLLLESSTAKMLANWAIAHYDKYKKAANKEMELIFFQKVREGLDKEIAEEIEEDILPDLSEEYSTEDFDLEYLIAESLTYLKSRQLLRLGEQLEALIDNGKGSLEERIKQAELLTSSYKPINTRVDNSIDLSKESSLDRIRKAFEEASECIIRWPKQLGTFWNAQFVAGGFISLLAPEKRGKTFWLLEIAMRACRQNKKVAFFQAGDMNEAEQLKRIGIYLTKKSTLEKYCKEHYEPVRDCIRNQMDKCEKKERECDYGIFSEMEESDIRLLPMQELIEAAKEVVEYYPCHNCKDYNDLKLGVPWVSYVPAVDPIESEDVVKAAQKFFIKNKRRFKIDTYPNGTLSVDQIISVLNMWEDEDGFIAEVIIIDYADILVPSTSTEFRHQQNQIWKDLRRLSQTKRGNILPLVIAPTQADAASYKAYSLRLDNFSEDKRKFGHVTAMYGLNQDPLGREKAIGITRINEVIIREGEFSMNNEVVVLQNLKQGRPYKQAFF